jgi:hypothetical protein
LKGHPVNRFAYLNPLVVTGLLLAPFIFIFVADAMTPEPGLLADREILSTLTFLMFVSGAAQLAWAWSLYEQAGTHARQPRARDPWERPLFAGVALILFAISLLNWLAPERLLEFQQRADHSWLEMILLDVVVFGGAAGFFTCHWLAATALLAAETPVPRAYSRMGTFLFTLYLFIGVWFLRPRLMALTHR